MLGQDECEHSAEQTVFEGRDLEEKGPEDDGVGFADLLREIGSDRALEQHPFIVRAAVQQAMLGLLNISREENPRLSERADLAGCQRSAKAARLSAAPFLSNPTSEPTPTNR